MNIPVKELHNFINVAVRNRKYPEATAAGLRVALKLFEAELNEEEQASIALVKKNLDQIENSVYNKNSSKFTASSVKTYRSRIAKVINDYETYGTDATKLANWNPKVITRAKRPSGGRSNGAGSSTTFADNTTDGVISTEGMNKLDLFIRPGMKGSIILPWDLRKSEAAYVTTVIKTLVREEGDSDEKAGIQAAPPQ